MRSMKTDRHYDDVSVWVWCCMDWQLHMRPLRGGRDLCLVGERLDGGATLESTSYDAVDDKRCTCGNFTKPRNARPGEDQGTQGTGAGSGAEAVLPSKDRFWSSMTHLWLYRVPWKMEGNSVRSTPDHLQSRRARPPFSMDSTACARTR